MRANVVPSLATKCLRWNSGDGGGGGVGRRETDTAFTVQSIGGELRVIISSGRRAAWAARKERLVVMRRQALQTARQRSMDLDGRRTRISAIASSHKSQTDDDDDDILCVFQSYI
jgi:hypothetical protein